MAQKVSLSGAVLGVLKLEARIADPERRVPRRVVRSSGPDLREMDREVNLSEADLRDQERRLSLSAPDHRSLAAKTDGNQLGSIVLTFGF